MHTRLRVIWLPKCLPIIFFLLTSGYSRSQEAGCIDRAANNYSPSATLNNGSCTYNITSYSPAVDVDSLSDSLSEISGMQWAQGSLWALNDGGGRPAIYRIDTATSAIFQTVTLAGATNVDWEDMAFDGTWFYIGDIGNNANGARMDLRIYKFPISAIAGYVTRPFDTIPADLVKTINFTYNNQPQPPVAVAPNSTPFDCEAMIVDKGKIHLFTKNWIENNSTHYVIDSVLEGTYAAMPVETLATNYLVTSADKAAEQDIVVLLGYQSANFGSHFIHMLSGYDSGRYFNGNKRRIDLPNALIMGQSEGITFANGNQAFISNEKFTRSSGPFTITIDQKLRSVYLPFVYAFTGAGNWNNPANWFNNMIPHLPVSNNSEIYIDPMVGSQCNFTGNLLLQPGSKLVVQPGKELVIQAQ
jgi:hypothetical protein